MAAVEDVRRVIEQANARAVQWYAARDVDSLAALFTDDGWQMPPNTPALVGRAAIRDFWRTALGWGKWDFTLLTQAVDVSEPIAVERGKYVLRFTAGSDAPPGMKSFEDRGNYLVHWRHQKSGDWLIVADAPVSELPPPREANR